MTTNPTPRRRALAIVGRPNVGKSTLFNRLVGRRLALVDDRPGVTRDRREGDGSLYGLDFRVIDTAGYEEDAAATLPGRMRAQTEAAVADAAVAALVVDARAGLTPLDEEIARWLRGTATPVVLLANKAEGRAGEAGINEAWSLGLGEPIGVSAEHGEGMADLHEAIRPHLEAVEEEPEAEEDLFDLNRPLRLAIVGRPNAGKSTLINRMVGSDRLITGPEAGITRDAITVDWEWRGRPVTLVDTAGMRKRARVDEKLEKLSVADALRAIDHAEVVVLLLDSTRGLEVQDLKIAARAVEEGRALVIGLNKWDVAEGGAALYQGVRAALNEGLAQLRGVPLLTLSGATGKGVDQIVAAAFDAREAWGATRIHRRAQPLVRGRAGGEPAAGPRRSAHQAALHHPGRGPPADLRAVRHARGPAARELPSLPVERHSGRARLRLRTGPAAPARAGQSVRSQAGLTTSSPFRPDRGCGRAGAGW